MLWRLATRLVRLYLEGFSMRWYRKSSTNAIRAKQYIIAIVNIIGYHG